MRFRAFSSEVDTGSREENASNKEVEPPFRFNRNGKGCDACGNQSQSRAAQAAKESSTPAGSAARTRLADICCQFASVPVLAFGFTEAAVLELEAFAVDVLGLEVLEAEVLAASPLRTLPHGSDGALASGIFLSDSL